MRGAARPPPDISTWAFARQKENGLELEFREQFIWSVPQVLVSVDFWADEAVGTYWIDSVQPCPCAK